MTDMQKAFADFWGGFTFNNVAIPAYVSGQVPDGASLPYITFEFSSGACFGRSLLTAIAWFEERNGHSLNSDRLSFFEQVKAKIPEGGVMIPFTNGGLYLFRNDTNFVSAYDPGEVVDGHVVFGGRVSYGVEYFVK